MSAPICLPGAIPSGCAASCCSACARLSLRSQCWACCPSPWSLRSGLTIVFSLLLASSGLLTSPPETLSRAEVGCIGLVLLGVTAVSAFGPHDASAPSLDTLLATYSSGRFASFALVGASAAALVLCPCGSKLVRSPAGDS
jgi:hypothetical protein